MPRQATIDIVAKHLFTDVAELTPLYDEQTVARILRLRELYTWYVEHPGTPDREFVERDSHNNQISKQQAYADLAILKALLPQVNKTTREFYRYRTNEMLLEVYNIAKSKGDTKTMERVATSIGKLNRVDLDDEKEMPLELILVQPFTPTVDPSVLGLERIPNLAETVKRLEEKYGAESMDFEDVDFEEVDLLEAELFPQRDDAAENATLADI